MPSDDWYVRGPDLEIFLNAQKPVSPLSWRESFVAILKKYHVVKITWVGLGVIGIVAVSVELL